MNLFTCTARIITIPKLSFFKKKALIQMVICIHNNKKKSLWYYIYTTAKGKLANHIFNIYNRGDFIIIQGYIHTTYKQLDVNNNFKKKKFINLKINKIYPIKKIG